MKYFRLSLIYLILTIGAVIFCTPFFWMLSTALKPVEQTMTMPPVWLPYRYYIKIGEAEQPVKFGEIISKKSWLVMDPADGKKKITNSLKNNFKALEEIPATEKNQYAKMIYEEDRTNEQWELVPISAVSRKIEPRWDNFINAVKAMKYFPLYLKNTLLLCLLTVIGTVSSSAIAAYGFSCLEWKGRDRTFIILLGTMMIPFPVVMVPIYCLFRAVGLVGTIHPLWIGTLCAGAFNVFLLRQFFMTIPKDLIEAARIDGCSELMIFLKIIIPIAKPALKVVALFQFMGTWNDFLGPLIYLTDQKDFTLALGLQFFQSQHGGTEWHYLMAASIIIVLPVIVLFFFTQKTFIEGIAMTGLKG